MNGRLPPGRIGVAQNRAVSRIQSASIACAAAVWYSAVILPEARTEMHRQRFRRDVPWYHPNRSIPFIAALAYSLCLPGAVLFHVAGRSKPSQLASSLVVLNPPTLLIGCVFLSETLSCVVVNGKRFLCLAFSSVVAPFCQRK